MKSKVMCEFFNQKKQPTISTRSNKEGIIHFIQNSTIFNADIKKSKIASIENGAKRLVFNLDDIKVELIVEND